MLESVWLLRMLFTPYFLYPAKPIFLSTAEDTYCLLNRGTRGSTYSGFVYKLKGDLYTEHDLEV